MAKNPKVFDIRGQSLKLDTAENVVPLLQGYDATLIEEVHLGGNTIGIEAAQEFAKFLANTEKLKVADFADIFTGRLISEIPDALKALCDAIEPKSTLVEINLSDNAFGVRSVEPMRKLLENNRFQILRLNNNGLGPEAGTMVAGWLKKSAELSKEKRLTSNLKTVICGRNRLENGSAPAWAEAFAEHGTLVEVRLPQNAIWSAGIEALAEGLSKCQNLRYLDLQDNTFIKDGSRTAVDAWAKALPQLSALETLVFSDCVLSEDDDDDDVPPLINTLAEGSNKNLLKLVLQNNNLKESTFKLFASTLESSLPKLKRLELQWNEVDESSDDIDTIRDIMTKRSGKLIIDEDEEEEGEEKEEEEEVEVAEEQESPEEARKIEGEVDALADMMNKVSIK